MLLAFGYYHTDYLYKIADYFSSVLHVDGIQEKLIWTLGFPAGFKPNINLAHFIGNYALELIITWRVIWGNIVLFHKHIVIATSFFSLLGFSVFLAVLHDILFLYSLYIIFMYSVFAKCHNVLLDMAKTLY